MSKTQDKRERRKAEQQAFIKQRRQYQLAMAEAQYKIGMEIFEEKKHKLSEAEIAILEEHQQKYLTALEEFKKENGLDEPQG